MSKSKRSKSKKKTIELSEAKIGFIGAGKMAECIVQGLISHGKIEPKKIYVGAPSDKNSSRLKELGVQTTRKMIDIFGKYQCDIVFLAIHGGAIQKCYADGGKTPRALFTNYIPGVGKRQQFVLSLVSGFSLDQIKPCLLHPTETEKYSIQFNRIMINAACAYGVGICAVDVEPDSDKFPSSLRTMLSSIARVEYVPETQMDAACALCGAGLAFSYYFIAALSDGAFKMGLSRQMALKFAAKTVMCAASSLLETGKHPGELKDSVCSPKGGAIYGIHVMDKADCASGITAAVEAAHKRAIELAKG
ncbi:pyrroline-5-carboxylate reductase-like protein 1 [Leptotrombidium deliense]|uniref:Pyrroline-5-carboxylate reductase 3 n=1 Tax=Leptotrombidium deliense TaxID=299467 RepID=A0A443S6X8_9ACAR|nr:pyrroline-5-carboxylate reductase-like protein 1 [Leptotrombidium deliense]